MINRYQKLIEALTTEIEHLIETSASKWQMDQIETKVRVIETLERIIKSKEITI